MVIYCLRLSCDINDNEYFVQKEFDRAYKFLIQSNKQACQRNMFVLYIILILNFF